MKRFLYLLAMLAILAGALYGGMRVNRSIAISACADSGGRWDPTCDCCDHSVNGPVK